MRYLNSIYDLLFEAVESYQWEFIEDTDKRIRYSFIDMNDNKYLVEFKNIPSGRKRDLGTQYELCYYVYDEDKQDYNVSKVVNVNPYRTLQTVFGNILNDFIERKSWVKKISLQGLSKDQEGHYISQRTRMYARYLERNPVTGYKMVTYNNTINLIKI
jgi:hypothetical protein